MRSFNDDPIDQDQPFIDLDSDLDSDSDRNDPIKNLKKEVSELKTQVKYLKRMMLLNVFDSKDEMRKFFADIW